MQIQENVSKRVYQGQFHTISPPPSDLLVLLFKLFIYLFIYYMNAKATTLQNPIPLFNARSLANESLNYRPSSAQIVSKSLPHSPTFALNQVSRSRTSCPASRNSWVKRLPSPRFNAQNPPQPPIALSQRRLKQEIEREKARKSSLSFN